MTVKLLRKQKQGFMQSKRHDEYKNKNGVTVIRLEPSIVKAVIEICKEAQDKSNVLHKTNLERKDF